MTADEYDEVEPLGADDLPDAVTTTKRDDRTDAELVDELAGFLRDWHLDRPSSIFPHAALTELTTRLAEFRAEVAALREAATNLLDRMSVVYADNRYKSVWTLAYTHGDFYRDGPDWAPQEATLRAVIANMKEAS